MPSFPQPFSPSFSALVDAEIQEGKRATLSEKHWFKDVFRISASTIPRVFRPVLCITLWATIVAVADLVYDTDLGLTNNVVPLLSVVVGLLLVFRNSTAYARWQEGRTLFSNMSNGVRNLARILWCSVGSAVYSQGRLNSMGERVPYQAGEYGPEQRKEKIAAVRLLVGLVVASKHHVRMEYGTDYEDLRAVVPHQLLARFKKQGYGYGAVDADYAHGAHPSLANKASMTSLGTSASAAGPGVPDATSPLLSQRVYDDETVIIHKLEGRPTLPLPIVIAHRLQLYFAKCRAQGLLESVGPAGYNAMTTALSSLVSEFAGMERLLTLPLPTIYGVHLKQTVTAYLMVLPLVLVDTMTWKMIPFVTLIAWLLIGIEEIALQIEQPFGFDASDLPLDLMCAELRNEVEQIIARLKEAPEDAAPLFR